MNSQPSKPDQLRFSGPELGDLLDRVVSEHGEEAAIAAVNRIRSGGVAGFFCREEFEVVVDPDGEKVLDADLGDEKIGATVDADPVGPTDPVNPADLVGEHPDDETIAEVIGRTAEDRPPSRLGLRRSSEPPVEPIDEDLPDLDFGSRAPVDAVDAVDAAEDEPAVFGGPVAPGSDPARDRFLALLERRLDETSAAEDDLAMRRTGSVEPVAPAPASSPILSATPALAPTSGTAPATTPAVSPTGSEAAPTSNRPRPVFWRRLDRVRDELASFLPAGSSRTAVVGPLPLASAVVNRLQSTTELATAEVIALTDRAGIVSEPTWRLERNGDRLIRALEESDGRPTIVVIDVPSDLPPWVGPLQRQLRSAGVGLFRYTVPGQPDGVELERYRQGADVPYAIDLSSRVEPGLVVSLMADRHPVVSVAGADLGPELLLALRRHVGGAELLFEPVIDG